MLKALSTSKWKWTWRFLLLAGVSVAVFALGAFIGSRSGTGETPIAFLLGLAGAAGLLAGIIGAPVSFVTTLLRRHSPPAKPLA